MKDIPRNLKPYFLALFKKGPRWNLTEGAEDLAQQQLAFLRAQFEAGSYRVAGPITDGSDFTAMAILEAEDLEAALRLASEDPAVRTAHLSVEVRPVLLPALDAVRAEYQ